MSLSLTTFASGATIDATVMRTRLASIEAYLNEESVRADRGSGWLNGNHIYRPDFYGAPNPHTTLVSGESYFRQRPTDDAERAVFSYYLSTDDYVPVPGLGITFQVPETLAVGTYRYRVMAFVSFYVYDWGGLDGGVNGRLDDVSWLAASMCLRMNGSNSLATKRDLYKGSQSDNQFTGAFYPRKQHSMVYVWEGSSVNVGVNHLSVAVRNYTPVDSQWKHIIFQQGNMLLRYYLR